MNWRRMRESGYWEHNDAAQLQAYFDRLDRLAKSFSDHLAHDVASASDGDLDNLEQCVRLAAEMTRQQESSGTAEIGGKTQGGHYFETALALRLI